MASDFDATSDRPKLPALRAEVLGATSVKTPRLYPVHFSSPKIFGETATFQGIALRRGLSFLPSALAEIVRGVFLVTAMKYLQRWKESRAAMARKLS